MTWIILIIGFLTGAILQYAHLNRYNVISALATRENFAVVKTIALAIGISIVFLNIEIGTGVAAYHLKPLLWGGVVLGGLLFGTGMAVLGYCPRNIGHIAWRRIDGRAYRDHRRFGRRNILHTHFAGYQTGFRSGFRNGFRSQPD